MKSIVQFCSWMMVAASLPLLCSGSARCQENVAPPIEVPATGTQQPADEPEKKPLMEKWRTITHERRALQDQLNGFMVGISVMIPDENNAQVNQILKFREQLDKMKLEVFSAAAEAYIETPDASLLLARDALGHLRLLMGEDESVPVFDPGLALSTAQRMLAAGSKNPQMFRMALRAAVAIQDFDQAQAIIAEMEKIGGQINQQFLDRLEEMKASWTHELECRTRDLSLDLPIVQFETSQGIIVAELFEDDAPNTVNNFVSLVQQGFYNNKDFFSIQPGLLAMSGCPQNSGFGDAGYFIEEEHELPTARKHFAGSLTTFHPVGAKSSSQFSLAFQPIPERDHQFTVFGRIIEGLDILYQFPAFASFDRMSDKQPVKIISVKMLKTRSHEYKPANVIPGNGAPLPVTEEMQNSSPPVSETTPPESTSDGDGGDGKKTDGGDGSGGALLQSEMVPATGIPNSSVIPK